MIQPRNAKDAELYYKLGCDCLEKEHDAEAIEFFTLAIRDNFRLGEAYIVRGICYHRQKKFSLALDDMKIAAALGQKDAALYIKQIQEARQRRKPTEGEIWVHKIRMLGLAGGGIFGRIILDLACAIDNIDKYNIE